jgi:hypothetical protein
LRTDDFRIAVKIGITVAEALAVAHRQGSCTAI